LEAFAGAVSAKLVTDTSTGQSKGFGFVRFKSVEEKDRAIRDMHGVVLGDRPIRVTHATTREERGLAVFSEPRFNAAPGRGVGERYAAPRATEEGENTCVFVGGLDESVTPDVLRHHFGLLGDIAYIRIPPGRGCGFVGFVHRKNAENAISTLQGLRINGYKVRLSWGSMRAGVRTAAAKNQAAVAVARVAAAHGRPLPGSTPTAVVTSLKKEHNTAQGSITHEYADTLPEPPGPPWTPRAVAKSSSTKGDVLRFRAPLSGPLVFEPEPNGLLDPDDDPPPDEEEAASSSSSSKVVPASAYVAQLRARYAAYNTGLLSTTTTTRKRKRQALGGPGHLARQRHEAAVDGVEIPLRPLPALANPGLLGAFHDTPMALYASGPPGPPAPVPS